LTRSNSRNPNRPGHSDFAMTLPGLTVETQIDQVTLTLPGLTSEAKAIDFTLSFLYLLYTLLGFLQRS